MVQIVLKPHNLDLAVNKDFVATPLYIEETENAKNKENFTLKKLINCGYQEDLLPSHVLQQLANRANYSKNLTIVDFAIVNGRLHYQNRLYVPDYHTLRLHLSRLHHDLSHAGHLRIGNTYE